MKRFYFIAIFALQAIVPLSASEVAKAPLQLKDLDTYVHKVMKQWHVPGLAIAVVKDGKVVFTQGYGIRELGKPGKVNTETLFGIGSNSKQFTAAALGTLVQAGKLAWNAPAVQYLSNFKLTSAYVTEHVTLRDLLSHRTGYCDPLAMWYTSDTNTAIERMRYQKPTYGFRAHFCYNNLMFIAGAHFIPAITGESYKSYIRKHVFDPLAMTHTMSTTASVSAASNVASPHAMVNGTMQVIRPYWPHNLDIIKSVGGIYSNANDMTHWLLMMLDNGRYDGRQILSAKVVHEMETPQSLIEKDSSVGGLVRTLFAGSHYYAYGLGLIIQDYGRHKFVWHIGDVEGMDAAIGFVPDQHLGIAVLANAWHAPSPFVMRYIVRRYLRLPRKDISDVFFKERARAKAAFEAEQKKLAATRKPLAHAPFPLTRYTGLYRDKFYGTARISFEKGHLVLRLENPYFTGDLEHWHDNTFRVTWRYPFYQSWNSVIGPVYVTFNLNAYGEPVKMLFNRVPLHYERVLKGNSH